MKRPVMPVRLRGDDLESSSITLDETTIDEAYVDDTFADIVSADAALRIDTTPEPMAASDHVNADSAHTDEVDTRRETGDADEPARPEPAEVTEKGFFHFLGLALSAALLLLVAGLAALVIVIPFVTGGQALTVLTQSMEPGYPPGTLIVIKPTPVADISIGDVLTYQITSGEAAVVSHRVVTKSVGSDGSTVFTTKGDNNDLADPDPVQEVQIKGTLWYAIPYLGYVNNAVNGDSRQLVVPVLAGGLFLYAAVMVIGSARDRRRKKAAAKVS